MELLMNWGIELGFAGLFLIPAFCGFQACGIHNIGRTALYILFSLYIAAVFIVVGFPSVWHLTYDLSYNYIPFVGMDDDLYETAMNVVMFIPYGIFLPVLWDRYGNLFFTLGSGFLFSLFIETGQIFSHRASDINDLITNTAGTLIGYVIAWVLTGGFGYFVLENQNFKHLRLIFVTVFIVIFTIQPLCSMLYWSWKLI